MDIDIALQGLLGILVISTLARQVVRQDESAQKARRTKRDLVFENMVMRTHNSTTRKVGLKPVVGGGILERKIMIASNGTQRTHHESRGKECSRQGRYEV